MSVQGCTNICRQAFEFAKKTGRKRVTLVEKPNVLRETGGLMTRFFPKLAEEYPDIRADEANIDAICMWMFKNPQDYSVIVAENMFGDIVSDLVRRPGRRPRLRALRESRRQVRGLRAHARLRAEVRRAVQGQSDRDAPDRQADARLAEGNRQGHALESAVARVIKEGKVRTYDMGGKSSTLDVAKDHRGLRQLLSWAAGCGSTREAFPVRPAVALRIPAGLAGLTGARIPRRGASARR